MKLLFKCHFLINAADKVVAMHSMRRWKVNLYRKHPPTALAPFQDTYSSKQALIQHYLASPSLLGSVKFSG